MKHAFDPLRDAAHPLLHRIDTGQNPARFREKHAAGIGKTDPFRVPLEQSRADRILERADLLGKRRLLNAELGCGARHVTRLGNRDEVAQVT